MKLILMMIFGAIGTGYIFYGKKQEKYLALISGVFLLIYPYFFKSLLILIVIGIILVLLPFISV